MRVEHKPGAVWTYYGSFGTTSPSLNLWPLFHDRNYRFKVRALNAAGPGAWSSVATFWFE